MEPQKLIGHGSLLIDEAMPQDDWGPYLKEVCFSPDGKLVAALATDGVIRVCSGPSTLHDRVAIPILKPRRSMHCGFWDSRFGIIGWEAGHLCVVGWHSDGLGCN